MSALKKGPAFYEAGSWYHRVKILRDDGTTKYTKRGGFQSEEEATESYNHYEREYQEQIRRREVAKTSNHNIKFKDYLVYWFEDIYSKRIETTTRMVGAYTLYNLLLPNMDDNIRLLYVTSDYLESLLDTVAVASESAGNKGREFLGLAFKDAVTFGYAKTNPMLGTKAYPRKPPSVKILSKEKIKVLLAAAAHGNWYLEILLALFCGLRKGEILGLKFTDFDFEQKTVTIERQITSNPIVQKGSSKILEYGIEEKEPKTDNSYRTIRVPDVVMEQVACRMRLYEEYKTAKGDDFYDLSYVSCRDNGLPHAITSMNTELSKLCFRNGLPHITVHGLRHMYATILLEQGVPLVKISALLGHASITTTFEYYCDVIDENDHIITFMNSNFVPEEAI